MRLGRGSSAFKYLPPPRPAQLETCSVYSPASFLFPPSSYCRSTDERVSAAEVFARLQTHYLPSIVDWCAPILFGFAHRPLSVYGFWYHNPPPPLPINPDINVNATRQSLLRLPRTGSLHQTHRPTAKNTSCVEHKRLRPAPSCVAEYRNWSPAVLPLLRHILHHSNGRRQRFQPAGLLV